MKTRKRRFPKFRYRECGAFAEYLQEQSTKGWHFKEWKFGLVFEKGEPENVAYDVEVLPKGSEMSLRPEMETEEYAEYCKSAGWKMIDSQRRFCIFRKEKEDAVPIVTEEERFDNVYHAEWKSWLNLSGAALFLTVLYCMEFWFLTFETWAFSNVMIFLIMMLVFQSVVSLAQAVNLMWWRWHNLKKIKSDEVVRYTRQNPFWRYGREITFIIVLIGFSILAWNEMREIIPPVWIMIGLILLFTAWIMYWRPNASNNRLAQLIGGGVIVLIAIPIIMISIFGNDEGTKNQIHRSEIPFGMGDFCEAYEQAEIEYYDAGYSSSILGNVWNIYLNYYGASDNQMSATLYQSDKEWVMERIWKFQMKHFGEAYKNESCAEEWEALEAWKIAEARYYVHYPNQILILSVPNEMKKDEIEKLKRILKEMPDTQEKVQTCDIMAL